MYSSVHFGSLQLAPAKIQPITIQLHHKKQTTVVCFTATVVDSIHPVVLTVDNCRGISSWVPEKIKYLFPCLSLRLALQTRALGKHLLVSCTVEPHHCNLVFHQRAPLPQQKVSKKKWASPIFSFLHLFFVACCCSAARILLIEYLAAAFSRTRAKQNWFF